ncbi:flagellar assembly protein FliW [Brucepastera parasyntrophica]|uniref:flagellar assembly protein FliW n=1 Tax=Brucepastera parasyntrophica TaxID=2880008 RepID=UPI00210EC294|nr:flagellar assembly protein FliW [Brucepastera parasyntrophica]ULQ59753.1 flagellar assembly protein FliW [Brucepastera parasyntrophica]
MEVQTKAMGTVSIVEKQIIELEHGFYGFEQYHSFALIDAEQKPFIWVQSLENPELAFLVIDPFIFRPDYEIDVDDSLLEPLEIQSPSDVLVFVLLTVPSDGSPITANLQGPLIINKKNNKALQAILVDPRWQTKHDLVAEISAKRGS